MQPNTEEDRRKFLGGSDIPALLGIAPESWSRNTRLALYQDKIEPRKEGDKKGVMSRGHRWEAVVADMLVERLRADGFDVKIAGHNKRYRREDVGWMACEIDMEILLDGSDDPVNVEIKTVHPFKISEWGESGAMDGVPIYYLAQVQWGLWVTGRSRAVVAALFGADELRCYIIDRDNDLIAGIVANALAFWNQSVLVREPPPPQTLDDILRLFPDASDVVIEAITSEARRAVVEAQAAKAALSAAQKAWDLAEFNVKAVMAEAAELRMDGKVVATWKNRKFTWLDQQALKEKHPKIAREFTKSEPRRVFLLK